VKVNFHTNLDLACFERWPELTDPPRVGEYVESKSGLELKVVRVTYKSTIRMNGYGDEAIAVVELHLGSAWDGRTIADFNKWDRERIR
jgi:hypothetical protein